MILNFILFFESGDFLDMEIISREMKYGKRERQRAKEIIEDGGFFAFFKRKKKLLSLIYKTTKRELRKENKMFKEFF